MPLSARIARIGEDCVACGCCAAVCPRDAVRVRAGVAAGIDEAACIGCGRCAKACPAAIITIIQREGADREAETMV